MLMSPSLPPGASIGTQEHIRGKVFVLVLRIRVSVVAFAFDQFNVVLVKGVADVFQEDQAKDDVLVFRRVHVVSQLVSGEPKLGFKPQVGSGGFLL